MIFTSSHSKDSLHGSDTVDSLAQHNQEAIIGVVGTLKCVVVGRQGSMVLLQAFLYRMPSGVVFSFLSTALGELLRAALKRTVQLQVTCLWCCRLLSRGPETRTGQQCPGLLLQPLTGRQSSLKTRPLFTRFATTFTFM